MVLIEALAVNVRRLSRFLQICLDVPMAHIGALVATVRKLFQLQIQGNHRKDVLIMM
jgi:hypothetical protein